MWGVVEPAPVDVESGAALPVAGSSMGECHSVIWVGLEAATTADLALLASRPTDAASDPLNTR